MKKAIKWAVTLTDKYRRMLRGLLYGIHIGGNFNMNDSAFARKLEKALAPKKLR